MKVEPRIVAKKFLMVGAETPPVDFASDFEPVLNAARQQVREKLGEMKGVVEPVRMIGFWQPGGVYFSGVEVTVDFAPEGLVVKNLSESLFAVFDEQRRGMMGGPGGLAYKWLVASSEYEHNGAIRGDFEIFKNMTDIGAAAEAEILIPIKRK